MKEGAANDNIAVSEGILSGFDTEETIVLEVNITYIGIIEISKSTACFCGKHESLIARARNARSRK